MIRERVAEDVYVFTSQLYAQVNAGKFAIFLKCDCPNRSAISSTLTITPTTPWAIAGFPTQQSSVTISAALYLILEGNKL